MESKTETRLYAIKTFCFYKEKPCSVLFKLDPDFTREMIIRIKSLSPAIQSVIDKEYDADWFTIITIDTGSLYFKYLKYADPEDRWVKNSIYDISLDGGLFHKSSIPSMDGKQTYELLEFDSEDDAKLYFEAKYKL